MALIDHLVAEIARLINGAGAVYRIDAPHEPVDVRASGCDFFSLSGHKMCGPTGIGALWGRKELLEAMASFQGGGEMIDEVRVDRSTYAKPPARFEAGTPHCRGTPFR
jgi:cysteine desulfurase/selenocysteine lyase